MTNKEVCLRLSSPERKKKGGCAGLSSPKRKKKWVCGGNGRGPTRIIRALTCTQRRGQWNGCPTSHTLASTWPAKSTGPLIHVCTKVQRSARPSWVVSVPSVPVKLSCVCTAEQTQNPSSGIELLCGTGIFLSKPMRDCDVLSAQTPVF